MSALGDYIHHKTWNYAKYGVAYPREGSEPYTGNTLDIFMEAHNWNKQYLYTYDLESELKKNTKAVVRKEQQELNLDYGRKINEFKTMIINKVEGRNSEYSTPLSNKSEGELSRGMDTWYKIQRKIDEINRAAANGETVEQSDINSLMSLYNSAAAGQRSSILGNIQQGLNDYAAKAWKEELDGKLGQEIVEITNIASKEALEKAIAEELSTLSHFKVTRTSRAQVPSFAATDKVGSTYNLTPTNTGGYEIDFKANRQNYLSGSVDGQFAGDLTTKEIQLNGSVGLETILEMLESINRFGTHWLNRHAAQVQVDTSLDDEMSNIVAYQSITDNNPNTQFGAFVRIDQDNGTVHYGNIWSSIDASLFSIVPSLASQRFENHWVDPPKGASKEAAYTRVANIMAQVHGIELQTRLTVYVG